MNDQRMPVLLTERNMVDVIEDDMRANGFLPVVWHARTSHDLGGAEGNLELGDGLYIYTRRVKYLSHAYLGGQIGISDPSVAADTQEEFQEKVVRRLLVRTELAVARLRAVVASYDARK